MVVLAVLGQLVIRGPGRFRSDGRRLPMVVVARPAVLPGLACSRDLAEPRLARRGCAVLFLASLVLRVVLLSLGVSAASVYLITFTHLEALSLGALLALLVLAIPRDRWPLRTLRFLAMLCTLAVILMFVSRGQFYFWEVPVAVVAPTLLPVCFGYLLLAALAAPPESWVYRFWNGRTIRSFGRHSYALYLVHLPIARAMAQLAFRPMSCRVGGSFIPPLVAFIMLATLLSWIAVFLIGHLYEKHFLSSRFALFEDIFWTIRGDVRRGLATCFR